MGLFGLRLTRDEPPAETDTPVEAVPEYIPPDPQLAFTLGAIQARLSVIETAIDTLRKEQSATLRQNYRRVGPRGEVEDILSKGNGEKTVKVYRTGDVVS